MRNRQNKSSRYRFIVYSLDSKYQSWISFCHGLNKLNSLLLSMYCIVHLIIIFPFLYSYGLSYEEIEKGLPTIDTSKTLIREICPPFFAGVECRPGKYRRFDGLCNNIEHPTWGAANSPFQRLIGPLYADGINAPRISVTGRDLPYSRVVSRTMHPDDGYHDHAGTVMVIAWGQFMDHDFTLTGTPLGECCNFEVKEKKRVINKRFL